MSIRFRVTLLVAFAFACAWLARDVIAQDAAATAARELAVAAGQLPDPTVTVGINNLPVTGADRFSLIDDFMTMRCFAVNEPRRRSLYVFFQTRACSPQLQENGT